MHSSREAEAFLAVVFPEVVDSEAPVEDSRVVLEADSPFLSSRTASSQAAECPWEAVSVADSE